jgi:hypothetical protein
MDSSASNATCRPLVVLRRHLDHRRALYVAVGDRVERDVDAVDGVGVRVDRRRVERVDHRGLGGPARGADVAGDHLQPLERPPAEEHARPLPRERAGDGAADRAAAAVDHRALALQQH